MIILYGEETPEQAKQVVFWDRYDYQSEVEQQSLIFLLAINNFVCTNQATGEGYDEVWDILDWLKRQTSPGILTTITVGSSLP